jgi:Lrp/AsnC family leucine-responsive transcriptional regulator
VEDLDRLIVRLLTRDGRMSYTDLGKATGLSTSAVHQRVRRLEQRGVIRRYAAIVDPDAAGLSLTAFISVKPLDPAAVDDVPTGWPAFRRSSVPQRGRRRKLHPQGPGADPAGLEQLLATIRSQATSTRPLWCSAPYEWRPPNL